MKKIKLKDISTKGPGKNEKEKFESKLKKQKEKLDELQNLFYAEGKHALLIIFQGMDASGKDGAIKNVFNGINPQGCRVISFKEPTDEELNHDFLWRIHKEVPAKGMIHIFNR